MTPSMHDIVLANNVALDYVHTPSMICQQSLADCKTSFACLRNNLAQQNAHSMHDRQFLRSGANLTTYDLKVPGKFSSSRQPKQNGLAARLLEEVRRVVY